MERRFLILSCLSMQISGKITGKFIFSLILLSILGSCGLPSPNLQQLVPISQESICRVAILPFNNETGYSQGDLLFYRVFNAELRQAGNYFIAQEGDVHAVFRQMHILPSEDLDNEQIRILGDRLQVQFLISADIINMDENVAGKKADPSLAVIFRIIDVETGSVNWVTYHRRAGSQYRKVMHFGFVSTMTELVRRVSQEVVMHWFKVGGLKQCLE